MKWPGLLTSLLVCLSVAACATPGETRADYMLQGKIQNIINANELAHGYIFGGSVVDTKVVSVDGTVTTEHWFVKRGGDHVMYVVMLAPSPQGGTDIEVTLPEEDQSG